MTVDYVPFLARAVAELNPNTIEQRRALYDRARKIALEKLRTDDPTLAHADLRAESAALEAAIRRVETDTVRRISQSQPNPAHALDDESVEDYGDRPPLKDPRRWRIAVVAFGALAILIAGVSVYSFWPRILQNVRSVLNERRVQKIVEQRAVDTSYIYMRQVVYYRTNYPVGTIIVDETQNFLYVVRPALAALRYSIGIGSKCATLVGLYRIVRKEEWPGWRASSQQSANTDLERLKNPLGARALDLNEDYRIHGTNASSLSGQRIAAHCIGLVNDDVIDLYDRTPLESRVVVLPE